jgi:DNA-binding Xre family transcriptional regulator
LSSIIAAPRQWDSYPGISITVMVRVPLTPQDHERGRRLGEVLRAARGPRSMTSVATAVGMSPETLRKIETGRVPTPAFFTVVTLCTELGVPLDQLADRCAADDPAEPRSA